MELAQVMTLEKLIKVQYHIEHQLLTIWQGWMGAFLFDGDNAEDH